MNDMFTEEMVEQAKNDPVFEELTFCDDCMEHATKWIIYIRQLENAQIVAKEALETINHANAKLTKDVEWLQDQVDRMRKELDGKEREALTKKMNDLDNAHQRFVQRGKM